jgi:hypothetical protein
MKTWAAIGLALIVVLLIVAAAYWYRRHHKGEGLHGWRMQNYDDNPYAGQTYRCGRCNVGYHCPGQREGCPSDCEPPATGPSCPPGKKLYRTREGLAARNDEARKAQACASRVGTYQPQCHSCAAAGMTECVHGHVHVEACDDEGRAKIRDRRALHEGFGGEDWPQAGTFGATGDTYPYGNYADGLQMFYPTFYDQQYNHYWSRY